MVAHYYRNVSAVVLVYDVTRKDSFDALEQWVFVSGILLKLFMKYFFLEIKWKTFFCTKECTNHGLQSSTVPILIVGNKSDGDNDEMIKVPTNIAQR